MKRLWLILVYFCTHLGLVFHIILLNRKKKQTRLSVKEISILTSEQNTFSNEIQIKFNQKGAILVIIQNKYIYPIVTNEGVLKLPISLIKSKEIYISFIGVFQTRIQRLSISEMPLQTFVKQAKPNYKSALQKIKSVRVIRNKENNFLNIIRPKLPNRKIQMRLASSPQLISQPVFKTIKMPAIKLAELPVTKNIEEVKTELNNKQSHEK